MTDSLDAISQYLLDKIKANADAIRTVGGDSDSLALIPDFMFYGDQSKIPGSPAVCVEPNMIDRTLQGVSYRTENNISVFILVYVSTIQDIMLSRKQAQQWSEGIATLIHKDPQLGGLVIHGFCPQNESGYTFRSGTLFRTNRILYSGFSKTALR